MKDFLPEGHSAALTRSHAPFSLSYLEQAALRGTVLEAPVTLCDSDLNLHVYLGEVKGILPKGEVTFSPMGEPTKDIAVLTRVGKTVCFTVKAIVNGEGKGPIAILSRRDAQKKCYEQYVSHLAPGDIIEAKVTHLEHFCVFLDIGYGIVALLPTDAISVSRISHPSLRFSIGDECRVVIKATDETGRIYVTRKELLGTWEENAALFEAGQTVTGTVRSIEPYGVFIELTPNLTGLAERKENVKENTAASVFIKSISPDRMKIKLVVIDSCPTASPLPPPCFVAPTLTHLDRWQYSPPFATKQIETVFSE